MSAPETRQARAAIGMAVETLIALLDTLEGDPDAEETDAEDSFALSPAALGYASDGPGCPIADPDKGADDDGEGIDEREPESGI